MNPVLTGRAVEKKTNHVFIEQELLSSASDKVNDDAVASGVEQSLEVDYKEPGYKAEEINETF